MTEHTDDVLLDTILSAFHLRARITGNGPARGWQRRPAPGTARFHLVGAGSCRLVMAGAKESMPLQAGDFVLMAHEGTYAFEDHAEGAEILSGEFLSDSATGHPVLEALPDLIVTPAAHAGHACRRLVEMLLHESEHPSLGSTAMAGRLADALFIVSLRHHLSGVQHRRGVFAALADPRLRRAMDAMHSDPGHDWTVAALASAACLSRTVFAARFVETLGVSPYQYLQRWRMTQALQLLRDPHVSVAQVGERLGYETDASFRRSFKRIHGFGPGSFRQRRGDREPVPEVARLECAQIA